MNKFQCCKCNKEWEWSNAAYRKHREYGCPYCGWLYFVWLNFEEKREQWERERN